MADLKMLTAPGTALLMCSLLLVGVGAARSPQCHWSTGQEHRPSPWSACGATPYWGILEKPVQIFKSLS